MRKKSYTLDFLWCRSDNTGIMYIHRNLEVFQGVSCQSPTPCVTVTLGPRKELEIQKMLGNKMSWLGRNRSDFFLQLWGMSSNDSKALIFIYHPFVFVHCNICVYIYITYTSVFLHTHGFLNLLKALFVQGYCNETLVNTLNLWDGPRVDEIWVKRKSAWKQVLIPQL